MNRMSYEIIMVLGGENPITKSRSKKALELHLETKRPILLTGSHSSMLDHAPEKTEREQMREYLISMGTKPSSTLIEEYPSHLQGSRDVLGNLVFSEKPLQGIQRVALVTDDYHMPRALWIANFVYPTKRFIPYETKCPSTLKEKAINWLSWQALRYDLRNITPGDLESIRAHMLSTPAYSTRPKQSLNGILLNLARFAKGKGMTGIKTNLKYYEANCPQD